ncbi:MAG: hypothetical protein ACYS7Y_19515 [Planctomycetota bacterium]
MRESSEQLATESIDEPAKMKIVWENNTYSWIGLAEASYPRFEAWRSDDPVDDRWCLNMTRAPGARPVKVRQLESLTAAKRFADGLLAEFECVKAGSPSENIHPSTGKIERTRLAGSQRPRPQLAHILNLIGIRDLGERYKYRTDKA